MPMWKWAEIQEVLSRQDGKGQGERVEKDFRNAGYEDVIVDAKGYFEDWVERRAQEESRKEKLKVDQVVRALDGGTPVMKLPE